MDAVWADLTQNEPDIKSVSWRVYKDDEPLWTISRTAGEHLLATCVNGNTAKLSLVKYRRPSNSYGLEGPLDGSGCCILFKVGVKVPKSRLRKKGCQKVIAVLIGSSYGLRPEYYLLHGRYKEKGNE